MHSFKRQCVDDAWVPVEEPVPVIFGKNGMAWGIGLHPLSDKIFPLKMEGNLRSPAGIFSLGSAFGFLPKSEMTKLKIDYFQIDEFTEAVDDPLSQHYNWIVDSREVYKDWINSEKMKNVPLYEIGLVINHNYPHPIPEKGSAIFLHIWSDENSDTLGCTAMSHENLKKSFTGLKAKKIPF